MASSLEVRVPFTDYRLVQYVFALPKMYNYNNGVEKYILRKAMEREVDFPREILEREKVIKKLQFMWKRFRISLIIRFHFLCRLTQRRKWRDRH